MAKPLYLDNNGNLIEVQANNTSAGAADAGKLVQLNGSGQIDKTMLPDMSDKTFVFTENVAAGAFINIYLSAGVAKARNAVATSEATRANGVAPAAVLSGATGTVDLHEGTALLSGLAPGSTYFLSATTPGGVTTTPPSAAGQIVQTLGTAVSTTELKFNVSERVVIRG